MRYRNVGALALVLCLGTAGAVAVECVVAERVPSLAVDHCGERDRCRTAYLTAGGVVENEASVDCSGELKILGGAILGDLVILPTSGGVIMESGRVAGSVAFLDGPRMCMFGGRVEGTASMDRGAYLGLYGGSIDRLSGFEGCSLEVFGRDLELEFETAASGRITGTLADGTDLGAGLPFNGFDPAATGFDETCDLRLRNLPLDEPNVPYCRLSRVTPGERTAIEITAQDLGSGLANIQVLSQRNVEVTVPVFTRGTNDPVRITVVKTEEARCAELRLAVTDVAGYTSIGGEPSWPPLVTGCTDRPGQNICLAEDFEDGVADGFEFVDGNFSFRPDGEWLVVGDVDNAVLAQIESGLAQSGGIVGSHALAPGEFESFELEVSFLLDDYVVPNNLFADAAVVFGYQDARNYYFFNFNEAPEWNRLWRVVDGRRADVPSASSPNLFTRVMLADGHHHRAVIRRELSSGAVALAIDGVTVFEAVDTTFGRGRVGLGSINDAASFDNLTVVCTGAVEEPGVSLERTGPYTVEVVLTTPVAMQGGELALLYPEALAPVSFRRAAGFPFPDGEVFFDLARPECADGLPAVTMGWISSTSRIVVVPAGTHRLFEIRFAPAAGAVAGACAALRFAPCGEEPNVANRIIDGDHQAVDLATSGVELCVEGTTFRRGDLNDDGERDLADAFRIVELLFGSGPPLACDDAADIDDNGRIEINDTVRFLSWRFGGGPLPEIPFAVCGVDPTADDLDCATPPGCPAP